MHVPACRGARIKRAAKALLFACLPLLATGCAYHFVDYEPFTKNRMPDAKYTTGIEGRIDEYVRLIERANLPHRTVRERFDLECEAFDVLAAQLGSPDYILLGEICGVGNAVATQQTLREDLCDEASDDGGDVVLFFESGYREGFYSYTMPGYAHTNLYGSAYTSGGYTIGSARGHTTYTPGVTVGGTLQFPYTRGFVFKLVPGISNLRRRMATLNDAALAQLNNELKDMAKKWWLKLDDVHEHWATRLDELGAVPAEALERDAPAPWRAASKLPIYVNIDRGQDQDRDVQEMIARVKTSVVTIRSSDGLGSGVIISTDGFVLTACHVVGSDEQVTVRTAEDREVPGDVQRKDAAMDIALIKLDGDTYPAAVLGRSSSMSEGADVYAIGSPESEVLKQTVTRGIISGFRRDGLYRLIQSDVAINPGNSGGPLFARDGKVIGICLWSLKATEGLHFFLSIEDALRGMNIRPSEE